MGEMGTVLIGDCPHYSRLEYVLYAREDKCLISSGNSMDSQELELYVSVKESWQPDVAALKPGGSGKLRRLRLPLPPSPMPENLHTHNYTCEGTYCFMPKMC
jgi:hypothetical protein